MGDLRLVDTTPCHGGEGHAMATSHRSGDELPLTSPLVSDDGGERGGSAQQHAERKQQP